MLYSQDMRIMCLRGCAGPMSFRLTRFRIKAAALVCALLYAACTLVSSAAFAFAHGDGLLDCLTDHHKVVVATHHHDSQIHQHAGMVQRNDHQAPQQRGKLVVEGQVAPCCSIFAMVGLAGIQVIELIPANLSSTSFAMLRDSLDGHGPDLINRPPIR